ncbi:hypothetical protein F5884DRAFT_676219 [Xylogone sp. PMI_703]|nr:hypothetical protein F5884DRAFT_676219 [Xylogone sp. PMI_703]
MVLGVVTRLGSKYAVVRSLSRDDGVIAGAMVLGIVHTAMLSSMVTNGLGKYQDSLSSLEIERFEKFGYASQLVYVPALLLAKISSVVYLRALSPAEFYEYFTLALGLFIVIWGVASEFAIAFQCGLPYPWAIISSTCFDRQTFWDFFGTLDILTDIIVILIPAYLVWGIQMKMSRKIFVFAAFGTRATITPLTILRTYYISTKSSEHLSNQTFVAYYAYLFTTIQLNLSIFVACVPFLKPFMESLSSGAMGGTVVPFDSSYQPGSALSGKLSTLISGISSGRRPQKGSFKMDNLTETILETRNENDNDDHDYININNTMRSHNRNISNPLRAMSPEVLGKEDIGPLRPDNVRNFSRVVHVAPEHSDSRSSVGSDKMIIKRTTEWEVQEYYEEPRRLSTSEGGDIGLHGVHAS